MSDNYLVLGCGSIGKRHIANLLAFNEGRIVAFDPVEERRRDVARRFDIRTVESVDDGLAAGPRAVFVCSPNHVHLAQALTCARAGKHLFVEKPLSHESRCVDELVREAQRQKLHVFTGCNFRFHPGLRALKHVLSEGVLGRVVSLRAQFGQYLPDWHPSEDYRQGYSARSGMGGGVILDRIHEIDYAMWLLGDVDQVFAMAGRLTDLDIDTEDTAEVLLRFRSGAFGSIHLDYVRRTYECQLQVTGDRGSAEWSFGRHEVRWHTVSTGEWTARHWPGYAVNDMYIDELRHFLKLIDGTEEPVQTLCEAKRILDITLAAKRSAAEGRPIHP